MAIAFRAFSSASDVAGTATSIVINKPTGTVQNDVMALAIWWGIVAPSSIPTITEPSGWAPHDDTGDPNMSSISVNDRMRFYHKVAGASEPSSYTFTFSNTVYVYVRTASYSGVDTTTPVVAVHHFLGSSSSTTVADSITPGVANCQVCAAYINTASSTWASVPASMTSRDTSALGFADGNFASSGSTGTLTFTANSAGVPAVFLIALQPTTGGAAAPTDPQLERHTRGVGRGVVRGVFHAPVPQGFARRDRIYVPAWMGEAA